MPRATFTILVGPQAGQVHELPLGARLVVGRGEGVDLRLQAPAVSRRHLVVEHRLSGVHVEDLGSAGGLYVDDQRAAKTLVATRAVLAFGGIAALIEVEGGPVEPIVPPAPPGVRVVRHLGSGAAGDVYEAVLEATGATVALKVMSPEADAVARARFLREAALCARCDHPGIERILGQGLLGTRPYLLRTFQRGRTLEAEVARLAVLPWRRALRLGAKVARALGHAHARGVVHRDVKPANVVLDERDEPLLIDFDLARLGVATSREALERLTRTGEGLGSFSYVAPEQLRSAHDADARADVYGLGLTLYHAITGRRPFDDVEPEEYLGALATRGPTPLGRLAAALPPDVVATLEQAYAPQRDARHADGDRLADALERLVPA